MRERPILFSAPMVRALLDGSKTQTRRALKPQPNGGPAAQMVNLGGAWGLLDGDLSGQWLCPYGAPGDRLWVKESFWGCDMPGYGDQPCVVYDDEWVGKEYHPSIARPWGRKFGRIPSIHMPRESSRITLEITGIRVERLSSITEEDATAEGITNGGCLSCGNPEPCGCDNANPSRVDAFAWLWMQINGDGAWLANPWVWAIDFKRIKP